MGLGLDPVTMIYYSFRLVVGYTVIVDI
jgi:hypothetical protein